MCTHRRDNSDSTVTVWHGFPDSDRSSRISVGNDGEPPSGAAAEPTPEGLRARLANRNKLTVEASPK